MANPRLPEFDENSPLRPSRFGHIVLRTSRFKEMAPWYKTVLNAEPLFELPVGTFLTFDALPFWCSGLNILRLTS